ncbi:hypothetical protein ACFL2V_04380 [Pseudomonadota bacterium]
MKKQKHIKKIKPLIVHSVFLTEDVKAQLLEGLEQMGHEDLEALKDILTVADKKQSNLIDEMAAYDDTFVSRLKQFKKTAIRKEFHRFEKSQKKKAEDLLTEIHEQ